MGLHCSLRKRRKGSLCSDLEKKQERKSEMKEKLKNSTKEKTQEKDT